MGRLRLGKRFRLGPHAGAQSLHTACGRHGSGRRNIARRRLRPGRSRTPRAGDTRQRGRIAFASGVVPNLAEGPTRDAAMPMITSADGTRLYYEEAGAGTPVVFVHEFAGDYRTWEPQMRAFARSHRCVTFSARGYPPSDVPSDPARYGQDIARADVIALMDALGIAKAHVVGHSMGAYTALHVGIKHPRRCISVTAAGCGWGSVADPAAREAMRQVAADTAKMFTEKDIAAAAALYADGPTRQAHKHKDPRGYAEFARMLAEHSALGHALTMAMLQAKRP